MVQNMVFAADDAVEQPFVGGSAQFFKRTVIRCGDIICKVVSDGVKRLRNIVRTHYCTE